MVGLSHTSVLNPRVPLTLVPNYYTSTYLPTYSGTYLPTVSEYILELKYFFYFYNVLNSRLAFTFV